LIRFSGNGGRMPTLVHNMHLILLICIDAQNGILPKHRNNGKCTE
jgi:hypothetical protein